MYLLYDIVLALSAVALIPYYHLRGLRHGKIKRGARERLGIYLPQQLEQLRGKEVIWVHAVSVGETRAAIPLIRALKASHPGSAVVLTSVTETGRKIAQGIAEVDLCLFFPLDISWVVRRVLRQLHPALLVIVETEIWPNLVRLASSAKIPVVLVNGRISDQSYPRYRWAATFLKPVLQLFSAFCMQTEKDGERIRSLGAPAPLVQVTRNLKFDMQASIPEETDGPRLRRQFRIPSERQVWVAGSTHAGEEEAVIEAFQALLDEKRDLLLVLVPRHPDRCRAVAEMLATRGLKFILRSQFESRQEPFSPGEILLVDSVGEMLKFYAMADLVFVGGSLVEIGGHNVLEASLLKRAVLFGPHMHNFRDISQLVLESGGGLQVENREALTLQVGKLLDDPTRRSAMGQQGYSLIQQNAGATAQTLAVIARVLQG